MINKRTYINPEAVDPPYYINDGTPEFEQSLLAVLPAGKRLEYGEGYTHPEAVRGNWYRVVDESGEYSGQDPLNSLVGPDDVVMIFQQKVLVLTSYQFETMYSVGGITGSVAADIASRVLPGMSPADVNTVYGEWLDD